MSDYGLPPPGFRLPASTRLGAVHLQVSAMARSIEYYGRVLGLIVLSSGTDEVVLGSPDDVALVVLHERTGARPAPRGGSLGLFHFAILLPDRAALGRFVTHVSTLGERAGMADHAVSEAIYLHDPDGLGIEVYADRPRAAWRHHGRQLHMTTESLDVRGLAAAGGGIAWDGVPAGTTMGHVHLHVGDLGLAARFYHAALGFDKVVWDYPGALFMSAGGYHHHLATNTWSPGPPAADDQARLLFWSLIVPDASEAARAARSLRESGYDPMETDQGWAVRDPWGIALRLQA